MTGLEYSEVKIDPRTGDQIEGETFQRQLEQELKGSARDLKGMGGVMDMVEGDLKG